MLFRQWGVCKCVGLCRSTAFCAEDLPRPTKSPLSTQRRIPFFAFVIRQCALTPNAIRGLIPSNSALNVVLTEGFNPLYWS